MLTQIWMYENFVFDFFTTPSVETLVSRLECCNLDMHECMDAWRSSIFFFILFVFFLV